MKMKHRLPITKLILFIAIALIASSCSKGPVYEKYLKMKSNVWDRFAIQEFEIPIESEGKSYDITLSVRNTDQFQYDELPVYLILTTSSGEERMREVHMIMRQNGKMAGTVYGKAFQVQNVIWKSVPITAKGKCKITIENIIPKIQTEGVSEIGIIMTRAKTE